MHNSPLPFRVLILALAACLAGPATAGAQAAGDALDEALGAPETFLKSHAFTGGLIVIAGLEDGDTALKLAEPANALVHGLVRDADTLDAVRKQIRAAGLYGRVSAMQWQPPDLPYADATVNLLLVLEPETASHSEELERVLAPNGIALFLDGRELVSRRKARPSGVDVWTHTRYDSTGNAVSGDTRAGPPKHVRWEAAPRWNRGVKTSSLVTDGKRLFYILDDSHFASMERRWSLIARDAYNGLELWRNVLPSWEGARGGKKVGPAQVNRRLATANGSVFVVFGEDAPVSVFDAATGERLRVLEPTGPADEFVVADGAVIALVNPNTDAALRRGRRAPLCVVAVNAETGAMLWRHDAGRVLPLTLAADAKQVVFHDGASVQSLDLETGARRWTSPPTGQHIEHADQANPDSPGAKKSTILLAPQFAPTLILYRDVVAFAGGCQLNVIDAQDGRELWRSEYAASNYSVPVDLFGFDGCLWGPDTDMNLWRPLEDDVDFNAYNLRTGAIEKRVRGHYGFTFQHHRCHQMKVVNGTVLAARAGIEFLDTESGETTTHHWVRGSCYYGVLPANGLLYVPPHDCACYIRAKLSGFTALTSAAPTRPAAIPKTQRLQRGPAYGAIGADAPAPNPGDWPTYRHDAARSGRASTKLDADLLLGWQTQLEAPLTSPVIAHGRVYAASKDAHLLHALDAATGEPLWRYALNARVDAPPTVYKGLVLCGCRDGSVHALRAADGALVWRFSAAPEARLIVARGQLESPWPVNGSVLAANDTAYFTAGRWSYLDGGLRFYGIEPLTGRIRVETVLDSRNPDGTEVFDDQGVTGLVNGILSSDGERIFLRHQALDWDGRLLPDRVSHLHGPDGYLSAETTTRILWTYAPMFTSPHQGAFYDRRLSRTVYPSGRILVEDGDAVYGFGENHYDNPRPDPGGVWALFSSPKDQSFPVDLPVTELRQRVIKGAPKIAFSWWKRLGVTIWAMTLTEDLLFAAGPTGGAVTSQAALEGKTPAQLIAVDPGDGAVRAEMTIPAAPTWDGMAAAGGNLYLTLKDGHVLCLWPASSGRPGAPLSAAGWRDALPELELAEAPGLLGRWRFDEGVGMAARDCSGRGWDAEVLGQWTEDAGRVYLATGGVPRAATIPDAPHLHFGSGDFSVALWVKIRGYDTRIMGKEAFPDNWWVVNVLPNGCAELVLGEGRGPGENMRARTKTPIPKETWTHLCVVADRQAGEVQWFVNGVLDSRTPIPETLDQGIHAKGHDLCIPSAHKPFRGCFDDLRIYGEALSEDRVQTVFEEGNRR